MANEPTLSVAEEQIDSPETTKNMQNITPEGQVASISEEREEATMAGQ